MFVKVMFVKPIRISLKTFEILRSVLQFILAKPPEES